MKWHKIRAVAVAVLLATGCVACGSGGGGADGSTPSSPATANYTEADYEHAEALAAWYVKARQK